MLRSPLANPMTTPMINPIRTGLSKITRAILNSNGTQYATLSEPVVLNSACEIEWVCIWPELDGAWFLADTTDDDLNASRFLTHSGAISGLGFSSATPLSTAPEPGLISRVNYKRSSNGDVSFSVNGEVLGTTTYSGPISINSLFTSWGGSTSIPKYKGVHFSTRIWKDGDRNSGELVTNLRFDEPDTIYQRNYAYPHSDYLYNSTTDDPFPLRTGAGQGEGVITTLPNGAWELRRADNYTSGMIGARIDYVNLPPGRYKFYFEGAREGNVAFMIRRRSNGQDYDFFSLDDPKEGWFDHDDPQGLYIQVQMYSPSEDAFARIDKFIIQEWDGAILNNVLPGDWEKISKKSGDDFWADEDGERIYYAEGVL